MRIKFLKPPAPGFGISFDTSSFVLNGYVPHTRADGQQTTLAVWAGQCSTCGALFEQKSPANVAPETRRCAAHRKPGKRVKS